MSSTQQIPPNMLLPVSLPAARWQTVMVLLEAAAGSLITEIQRQCLEAASAPEHIPARGNGADQRYQNVEPPC
jgi:hypothetical protein